MKGCQKMRSIRDFFVFDLMCDGREIATQITISSPAGDRQLHNCTAIWDTGATSSMISQRIAQELKLSPQGSVKVSGVHGVENANIYTVDLIFNNGYRIPDIQVSEAGNSGGFDLLVGMDVISRGIFIVDGVNHATKGCQIAFALPLDK